jgi:hypothetical protein
MKLTKQSKYNPLKYYTFQGMERVSLILGGKGKGAMFYINCFPGFQKMHCIIVTSRRISVKLNFDCGQVTNAQM